MRARLRPVLLLVLLPASLGLPGCDLFHSYPEKPYTLNADITFNAAGDTAYFRNNNDTAWRKIYITFMNRDRHRWFYVNRELVIQPGQRLKLPLSHFRDDDGNPLTLTRDALWRWRIEDSTRAWIHQQATEWPTG